MSIFVGLISVSTVPSRFTHRLTKDRIFFLFKAEPYSIPFYERTRTVVPLYPQGTAFRNSLWKPKPVDARVPQSVFHSHGRGTHGNRGLSVCLASP